ncbi:FAD-binding oxidoreductase [Paraconexibacter sp.]|uniref:FAD-binding oxidoreductase n=1 Tax=Paraconexibacter sp. TaxID=2949640 RepID=UPI0035669A00
MTDVTTVTETSVTPVGLPVGDDDLTTPRMRFWGWGVDGHDGPLPPGAEALMTSELGPSAGAGPRRDPVALQDVALPDSRIGTPARDALVAVVGTEHVRDDHATRVVHSAGKSYPDLVRLRTGTVAHAPDAVVYPADHDEVVAVLAVAAEHRLTVVPFGGGSSVVGGVEPLLGDGHDAVVTVDLARLSFVRAVDARSQTATVGAGTTGPEVERLLAAHGLTLGHYPQSFEFSTVGGWVATRSAGQASTGYGRIDDLVLAVRAATPAGEFTSLAIPGTAAGPDLRELLVGSEGTLGIITEVVLRVRPRPAAARYEAWVVPDMSAGVETLRELEQHGIAPAIARLSDEEETRLQFAMAGGSTSTKIGKAYLAARGRANGCTLILGYEGTPGVIAEQRAHVVPVVRRHGGVALGSRPGEAWRAGRFHGPYLRDELLARGVLVDTLETATSWGTLLELYRAVGSALRRSLAARGTPALVMCHVSHVYPTGASLYFTFLAAQETGAELEQWHAAKSAAGEAIVAAGGTITHHHAVGRDHAPWLTPEIGALGTDLLRAAKARVDPDGLLNPGKLIDGAPLPGA